MLSPRNVIYGFCTTTKPPKPKYLISLYQSNELNIIACFTTSQARSGILLEKIKHGKIQNNQDDIVSYVFLSTVEIGLTPNNTTFTFPKNTTVRFDYCFQAGYQDDVLGQFDSPTIVCTLHKEEYVDLIYAMYQSGDTPKEYKPIFEKILEKFAE